MNFVVVLYYFSVHFSTGISPYYLTFGSEACLPYDLIFRSPSFLDDNSKTSAKSRCSLSILFKSFTLLRYAFSAVC